MKRQSGFKIMKRLIVELKPLTPVMLITITMGIAGFLAAISIPALGVLAAGSYIKEINFISVKYALILMAVCAVLRGLLRYGEQLSGHYIAFKILYVLRDKIFTKLRTLAPAKLDGRNRGSLISLITSDIELLEVFYAHTIAPIAIAVITNTIIAALLFKINYIFGIIGIISFVIVGFVVPYASSSIGKEAGVDYREHFAQSNNYILDSLRGLNEVLQYKNGSKRLETINNNSLKLNSDLEKIKKQEGIIRAVVDFTIMFTILIAAAAGYSKYSSSAISFTEMILGVVILASSFGPVVALSNLSNSLVQTFACAERLFNILDEEPQVKEVTGGTAVSGDKIEYKNVDFTYEGRNKIFEDISISINKGDKIALIGPSGIGKSTFVKLLMRFYDVSSGSINVDNACIKDINTDSLRSRETLVSQETYLFNETIEYNIKIGNISAARNEVIEAAKKASIHDFIMSLPDGYETKVSELGSNLSSGEKQRIGLARSFLRNSSILILDEPTSNLDTLNESQILHAVKENSSEQTIILISHRHSTTSICDRVYKLDNKKLVKC